MSDEQKLFPWQTGQSTKPEVDALLKHWAPDTIKPGEWIVTDDEVKAIAKPNSATRYKTVTQAWRSRLIRDHGVIVLRETSQGFYCPTAEQVFALTHPTLEHAGRKIGKQLRRVSNARPQNEIETATQDHHGKLLYIQKRELKKARMNLIPNTAAPESVRISPPGAKQ